MAKKRIRKKKIITDTTKYLLSNEANKAHILEGIKQAKEGKGTKIEIVDLFK